MHKIGFSTHPDPQKSKTKGIILSRKELNLKPVPVKQQGNDLPWVHSGKYLGAKLTSIMDGFAQDTRVKRAVNIERNCELIQEFRFAHPQVKCKINDIYNSELEKWSHARKFLVCVCPTYLGFATQCTQILHGATWKDTCQDYADILHYITTVQFDLLTSTVKYCI